MALAAIANAIFSFDIAFLIDHVITNIFWFFAFYAAGWYFTDGKKPLIPMIGYGLIILFTAEYIFKMLGFTIYTPMGLLVLYLGRMIVLMLLEHSKTMKHFIPIGYVIVFFAAIAIVSIGSL